MNVKVLVATITAVLCGIITVVSLGNSTKRGVAFAQVMKATDRVDVYGHLDRDSIQPIKGATLVRFDLVEEKTSQRLAVLYDNPSSSLPANFPGASHAMAAGTWDPSQRVFHADAIRTKCPSKYEEKGLDVKTRDSIAQWQSRTGQTGS